jgi:hypothetical protein
MAMSKSERVQRQVDRLRPRKAQEEEAHRLFEEQQLAYTKDNPMRLLELIILAIKFGVGYDIRKDESDTIVLFLHGDVYPQKFHPMSQEWEMASAYSYFEELHAAQEKRNHMLAVKKRVLDGLTDEEKEALIKW